MPGVDPAVHWRRVPARMDVVGASIRVLNDGFIFPHDISLSQVRDAASMEIPKWRDDIIFRDCRGALVPRWGLRLGCD